MPYKILFTDVDGTLVPFGHSGPSPAVLAQLRRVQGLGVKVAVATGRGPAHISPDFLGGFTPDYTIAFNGAYIMDGARRALYAHPMSEAQFAVTEALGKAGNALGYSFLDGYYVYHHAQRLVTLSGKTLASAAETGMRFNLQTDRHLQDMPYVAFCNYPDEDAARFNRENPSLKLVYHRPNAYDLCQADHDKATAAAWLLGRLGLSWQQAVAIGDGGNDLELLQAAGWGVAMGGAPDFLRQAADSVTGSALEDGAADALRAAFP